MGASQPVGFTFFFLETQWLSAWERGERVTSEIVTERLFIPDASVGYLHMILAKNLKLFL